MVVRTPEVRTTDNKARLTLPKSFANSTLLVEIVSDVEIVIRRARVVPLSPGGEPAADSSPGPLSAADWELFLAVLDRPASVPEPLKKAILRQRDAIRAESEA